MAKATKTIRQALHYPPQYAAYFAANQVLFNRVVAFYFEVIQAHEGLLALNNKGARSLLPKIAPKERASHVLPPRQDRHPLSLVDRGFVDGC
jgi:hypothetical protein